MRSHTFTHLPPEPIYFISPCGNHEECQDIGPIPGDWTACTGMTDYQVSKLKERLWWASSKSN